LASCASPGCPVLRVLWPRWVTDSAGCPASSVLWPCRRWIFELPRISHPSAPMVSVIGRVTPFSSRPPQRFDQGLRLPFVLDLRLCRRWSFESPRTSHPSAVPIDRLPGHPESGPSVSPPTRTASCPASRIFRLRLVVSQVTLGLAPSGCVSGELPGLPRSHFL